MKNENIIDLIETLKVKKLSTTEMQKLADCFLNVVAIESNQKYSDKDLIRRANENEEQTLPLIRTNVISIPKLAHIMLGTQLLLSDIDIEVSLEDIEAVCKKSKQRTSLMLMPTSKKDKYRWKPM